MQWNMMELHHEYTFSFALLFEHFYPILLILTSFSFFLK